MPPIEPPHGENPGQSAHRSIAKPDTQRQTGRHFASNPDQDLNDATAKTATPTQTGTSVMAAARSRLGGASR